MNPNQSKTKEIMNILHSIQFYCDVMCRSEPNASHKIDHLINYGAQGPNYLLELVETQEHLKQFFIQYPQVFRVSRGNVVLKNWIVFHFNQQQWIKESLPQHCLSIPNIEIIISTIQFYCNIIFTRAYKSGLKFKTLFSYKMKAPAAIQALANSKNELNQFLHNYHMIFDIRNDKVYLTDLALSYKSMVVWFKQLFKLSNFIEKFDSESSVVMDKRCCDLFINSSDVNAAIGFYYNILFTNKSMKGISIPSLFWKAMASGVYKKTVRNWQDIKAFLSSYPQIFTVVDEDKVFLTHLLQSFIRPETSCNNRSLNHSSEDRPQSSDLEQLTIGFYSGILNQLLVKDKAISEIPIDHLFHYTLDAPSDVKEYITSLDKLKKVLVKYPTIFNINNNIVTVCQSDVTQSYIHKSVDTATAGDSSGISSKKVKKTIDYYCNLINEYGGIININQLLEQKMPDISRAQNIAIAVSLEELKKFLQAHPNVFILKNDKVLLASMPNVENSINKKCSSKNGPTEKTKQEAVKFYTRFIKRQTKKLVPLNTLVGHRGSAPPDVRSVAKNPIEMKAFLSQFPDQFTIVNNKVSISISHQIEDSVQDEESSPETNFERQQNAVDFLSKMLNHYGIGRVMLINKLFEYKLKSSAMIQEMTGSNIDQFKTFLMKHPDHFIVTNENVLGKKNIPKWSHSGKYENIKFTDPLLILIFNFFFKFTRNKSLFHIDNLYCKSGRYFLYSDLSPVFQNRNELLLFLSLYPDVFYVDSLRVVNIFAASCKTNFIPIFRKFPPKNNGVTKCSIDGKTNKPMIADGNPDSSYQNDFVLEVPLETTIDINPQINNGKRLKRPKGIVKRKIIKKKLNISSGLSDESLEFDPTHAFDFDVEADLFVSNSDILENNQVFWENQLNTYSSSIKDGTIKPLTIEEIENQVFSHFSNKLSQGENCQTKQQKLLDKNPMPFSGKVFTNRRFNQKNLEFLKFFQSENSKRPTMEALLFLNLKLWEYGRLQIFKMPELFNSFLQAGLELSKYYCRNLDEFKHFISLFPLDFIVSSDSVMSKKNKIDISYPNSTEQESLALILLNFFNMYTQCNNFLHIKMLYNKVGEYFVYIDQTKIFKYSYELVIFLRMFPDVFYIDNNIVRNLLVPRVKFENAVNKVEAPQEFLKIDKLKNYCDYIPESKNKEEEGWKAYVLQKTHVVEDSNLCRSIVEDILKCQDVIAVDCEGINLGVGGYLTLVQVSLENGQIFIFDILADEKMIDEGGLKDILESKSIVKVIHDSRNDIANLYTQYCVEVNKIFDTRVAHHLIVNFGVIDVRISKKGKESYNLIAIGLNELYSQYGAPLNVEKDEMKNVYKKDYMIWFRRPLPEDMLAYAAMDVAALIQIYHTMSSQMNENSQRLIWEISWKYSISNLDHKDLYFD